MCPHIYKMLAAFLIFCACGPLAVQAKENDIVQEALWTSGKDGYHTYRIPALAVTTKGTLLAFCEGRKDLNSDSGNIDLLVKRSQDNGETWSKQQVVWNDGTNTCGNPSPVVDRKTGTIWLLSTWNRGDDHEGQLELLDFLLAYAAAPEFEHPGGIGWQETLPGRYHVRNSAGMQELAGMVVSWAWYTTNWVI